MNRREFLRLSGIVGLATVIPISILINRKASAYTFEFNSPPGIYKDHGIHVRVFDSYKEYGRAIEWDRGRMKIEKNKEFRRYTHSILHRDAQNSLPRGIKYEIRVMFPNTFGRYQGSVWYTQPELFKNLPLEPLEEMLWRPEDGYYYAGRYITK